MGTLTERAAELEKQMNLAVQNVPNYARKMPGVGDSLRITRNLLALVRDMAALIERPQ